MACDASWGVGFYVGVVLLLAALVTHAPAGVDETLSLMWGGELLKMFAVVASGPARAMMHVVGAICAVAGLAHVLVAAAAVLGAWALVRGTALLLYGRPLEQTYSRVPPRTTSCREPWDTSWWGGGAWRASCTRRWLAVVLALFALIRIVDASAKAVWDVAVALGLIALACGAAKFVLTRVGAPFVVFAATALLWERMEFSAALFGSLITSALFLCTAALVSGAARLLYGTPRTSIAQGISECIRLVLFGVTLALFDGAPQLLLKSAVALYFLFVVISWRQRRTSRRFCARGRAEIAARIVVLMLGPLAEVVPDLEFFEGKSVRCKNDCMFVALLDAAIAARRVDLAGVLQNVDALRRAIGVKNGVPLTCDALSRLAGVLGIVIVLVHKKATVVFGKGPCCVAILVEGRGDVLHAVGGALVDGPVPGDAGASFLKKCAVGADDDAMDTSGAAGDLTVEEAEKMSCYDLKNLGARAWALVAGKRGAQACQKCMSADRYNKPALAEKCFEKSRELTGRRSARGPGESRAPRYDEASLKTRWEGFGDADARGGRGGVAERKARTAARAGARATEAAGKRFGQLDLSDEDAAEEGVRRMLQVYDKDYGEGNMTKHEIFERLDQDYDHSVTKTGTKKLNEVAAACRALVPEHDALRDASDLASSPLRWLDTSNMKYVAGKTRDAIDARVKAQADLRGQVERANTLGVWERLKLWAGCRGGMDLDNRKVQRGKESSKGGVSTSKDESGALGCRTEAHAADDLRGVTVGEVLDDRRFLHQWLCAEDLKEFCRILGTSCNREDAFFEVVTGWGSPAGDVYMALAKPIADACAATEHFRGLREFVDCLFILHIKLAHLSGGIDYGKVDGSRRVVEQQGEFGDVAETQHVKKKTFDKTAATANVYGTDGATGVSWCSGHQFVPTNNGLVANLAPRRDENGQFSIGLAWFTATYDQKKRRDEGELLTYYSSRAALRNPSARDASSWTRDVVDSGP